MEVLTALSKSKPESSADPLPQKWVARIFDRLAGQLGSKVADLYAGVPAETVQAEWALALSDFHPGEIDRGIRACATRAFAPTLGEFCTLCRPALDAEIAFVEAGHCLRQRDAGEIGDWSHPAVFRAAVSLSHEVRSGNYREVRKRWEWVLRREFTVGWSEIPEPPHRIGNTGSPPRAPTEQEREKLRQYRDLIAAGFSDSEARIGMGEGE